MSALGPAGEIALTWSGRGRVVLTGSGFALLSDAQRQELTDNLLYHAEVAVESADASGVTPPEWVTSGPDPDGVYNGTAVTVEPARLTVCTGWSSATGPRLWMDTALARDEDLSAREARQLAVALLQGAELQEVLA